MTALNTDRILSLLNAEEHKVVSARSVTDTTFILKTVVGDELQDSVDIHPDTSRAAALRLYQWKKQHQLAISKHGAMRRVNRVLEALNTLPNVEAKLLPLPVPAPRQTAHPATGRDMALAESIMALDQHLLKWCQNDTSMDAWLLVFVLRLMQHLGMSRSVAVATSAMLTTDHINGRWLLIPCAPEEPISGAHYRIPLPSSIWIPLRHLHTLAKKRDTVWLVAKTPACDSLTHQQKVKDVTRRLGKVSKQAIKALAQQDEAHRWTQLTNWTSLADACQYTNVLRGHTPVWSTLLNRYPLPTCTDMPLTTDSEVAHLYHPGALRGRLPDRDSSRQALEWLQSAADATPNKITQAPGATEIATDHLPVDWSARARGILRKFLTDVGRIGKKRLNTAAVEPRMRQLLEQYDQQLQALIGHAGSYPQWILHYCYYKLCREGNVVKSVSNEVSLLMPITLMLDEAVLDISDWNDETVTELQIAADSGGRWQPRTRRNFIASLRTFIRFCQEHGKLDGVHLPGVDNSPLSPSTLRTRILTPDHFQTVWTPLTQNVPDGDPRQAMALAFALGFYGGLRASEVLSLTLNDIVIDTRDARDHDSCWVEILDGKSECARRRVALHIMAPPPVVALLRGWIRTRRARFTKVALGDIGLLGPDVSPDAYTYAGLITPLINWLRALLGEDIDFHGLRHAAVSWTLLRLHAAQHRDFVAQLVHQHHWMFAPDVLDSTLVHFCGAEGQATLERGTLWLQVAKWIGHSHPSTMLSHYAHVLGIIHGHVLATR